MPKAQRWSVICGGGGFGTDLWRVPLCLSLGALTLFIVTVRVDWAAAQGRLSLPAWLSIGGIDDARALLGALLGAVSTVLALIFSVALLVLSMAANMLGPRLLYRFVRDGITQVTIGLFLATFLQIVLTFVVTRGAGNLQFVPQLTLATSVLLTLTSFACLVVYSHRVAMSIQTDNVVARIVKDLDRMLAAAAHVQAAMTGSGQPTSGSAGLAFSQEDPAALWARCVGEGGVVYATMSGYLETIRHDRLIEAADQVDAVGRLSFRPGQFVMKGSALAYVLPVERTADMTTALLDAVKIGSFRTLEQDLEFAIAQLVEIGLRALSPAVNDTFTGIRCVDRLGDALREFTTLPAFDGVWRGSAGAVRLFEPPLRFPAVARAAFAQMRQAAIGNPAIEIRLLQTWARLVPHLTTGEQRQAIADHVEAVWEAASKESLVRVDQKDVQAAYQAARDALGEASV